MTALQKEHIALMRGNGESYAKIAAALGISENTIKSFCRRNNLCPNDAAVVSNEVRAQFYCKQCGTELTQTAGRRARKFCSFSCRMEWWKAHPDRVNRKAVYPFVCRQCGREFTAYGNRKRKYCSRACYVIARFGAKAGGDS